VHSEEDLKKVVMRIYSDTLLSWPKSAHIFQAARLYTGHWQKYYFYKIKHVQPLVLTTHSPIDLLEENRQYYCYYKYYRHRRWESDNSFEMVSQQPDKTWIYIPSAARANDIIVVQNDTTFHKIVMPVLQHSHMVGLNS